jgi:hypothetical protein
MATRGRPRKLSPALIERVVFAVELGGTVESAADDAGVSARSLRRWQARGRRELDALSPEARLVLALDAVARRAKALRWEETARGLEELAPERWLGDVGDLEDDG